MPALRTQIEDAVIAALTPLLKPGKGGAADGYLVTLKPYQGPPSPESDDVKRLLDGGGPALLVTTEDAGYDEITMRRRTAEMTLQIVIYALSNHTRNFEARARGDVRSTQLSEDPGLYQLMQDVRDRLFGANLGIECVRRPYPLSENSLARAGDWGVWRLVYEVDADIEADNPLAEAPYVTEMGIDANLAGDDTADPIVEADRDLDIPGVEFYGTTAPAEVTSYSRSSPVTAVTAVTVDGPTITEFAADEYAYGVDASFPHAGSRAAIVPPSGRNLLAYSPAADPGNAAWTEDDVFEFAAPSSVPGPIGNVQALLVSLSGLDRRLQAAVSVGTLTIGAWYCFSAYMRKPTEPDLGPFSGVLNPADVIRMRADTGTLEVIEDLDVNLTEAWVQYYLAFVATKTEALVRFIFPAINEAIWMPQCIQLEAGTQPTPWIRTDGAAADRASTVINFEFEGESGRIGNNGAGPVLTLGDNDFALRDSEVIGDLVAKAVALP